jgi:exodeoxyribonuclease VII large subunit
MDDTHSPTSRSAHPISTPGAPWPGADPRGTMASAHPLPTPRPLSVSEATQLVKTTLTTSPALQTIAVRGEISTLTRSAQGHLYFSLKDDGAVLRCVMFREAASRLPFQPEGGLEVIAFGSIDVFAKSGQYQLYARSLEPAGAGAAALALEQLKKRLASEGLFDVSRKRRLPVLPRRIALVTSARGAAVRDMIKVATRRYPNIELIVVPCLVQGPEAPESIARALRIAPQVRPDVVIVGRGGGAAEDLSAFNTEIVVRAIRACPVPVVSAVGHEVNATLADLAADLRAPTPSAAAEMAVPERAALEETLATRAARLRAAARAALDRARAWLDAARSRRVLRDPTVLHAPHAQHLDLLAARLLAQARSLLPARLSRLDLLRSRLGAAARQIHAAQAARLHALAMRLPSSIGSLPERKRRELDALRARLEPLLPSRIERERGRLAACAGRLHALSPLAVLGRGYSLCRRPDGAIVRAPADAPVGSEVHVTLAEGALACSVTAHLEDRPP